MKRDSARSVDRLLFDVEWAISRRLGPRDLVPMLKKLLAHAEPGSVAWLFGQRQLAEVLLDSAPWQSALLARAVLAHEECDRAYGILGLAQSLLGNYRSAANAYRRALALSPAHPVYAHNLGHLLDVALGRPEDALRYLELAYRAEPGEVEIAGSYAHGLARTGRLEAAVRVLSGALEISHAEAEERLRDWLSRNPPGSP